LVLEREKDLSSNSPRSPITSTACDVHRLSFHPPIYN
jgi:hypothetical protein